MKAQVIQLAKSIARSVSGEDYPEGKVTGFDPGRRFWAEDPAYEPHFEELFKRPQYKGQKAKTKKKQ